MTSFINFEVHGTPRTVFKHNPFFWSLKFKCETLVDFLLAVYFISREGGVFSIFMCIVYFGHIINEELGWKETAIWG